MFFLYVDESGDCGAYAPSAPAKSGSPYFIMTGLIVPAGNWKQSLDLLKSYRRELAAKAYLPYDVEFHCSELIDPHKVGAYSQISVPDRWKMINGFAQTIGRHGALSVISIVIDKSQSNLTPAAYLTVAITKLYQSFDAFLKEKQEPGLVFFDRANEKTVTTHVRKLMGTGSSGAGIPGIKIGWTIEDPIFRVSADSIFIQAADVIAFVLKEKEFPTGARKKFNANAMFVHHLSNRCFTTTNSDEFGIVRA